MEKHCGRYLNSVGNSKTTLYPFSTKLHIRRTYVFIKITFHRKPSVVNFYFFQCLSLLITFSFRVGKQKLGNKSKIFEISYFSLILILTLFVTTLVVTLKFLQIFRFTFLIVPVEIISYFGTLLYERCQSILNIGSNGQIFHVKIKAVIRSVFRTQSNISNGVLLLKAVNSFRKKFHRRC